MQNGAKNLTRIHEKWPTFFPYMRSGPKNLTKIGKNTHRCKKCKLFTFFPLYAKLPKKRDQNVAKMTHFFPLYADWAKICDKNRPKMTITYLHILTHIFPLICKSHEILAHKWPIFGTLFYLICIFTRKTRRKLQKIDHNIVLIRDVTYSTF